MQTQAINSVHSVNNGLRLNSTRQTLFDSPKLQTLHLAAKVAQQYIKDFRLSNVTIFPNCSYFVARITDNIVCKIRPYNKEELTLSLRDFVATEFLLESKAPVVPFCENLPKQPVVWDNFLLSFRKYISGDQPKIGKHPLFKKGTGKALAVCHNLFKRFNPRNYINLEEEWKTSIRFPNIYETLERFKNQNLADLLLNYCINCRNAVKEFQTLAGLKLDLLDQNNGQFLHGDFNLLNTLTSSSQIIVNDLEKCCFGIIEHDLATLLADHKGTLLSKTQRNEFLLEYKENNGIYEEELINWCFEMQILKQKLRSCSLKCELNNISILPF